jgi:hypothetical protein
MPPWYKFGVGAYEKLSKSAQQSGIIDRVERWVASCWARRISAHQQLGASGPFIFRAVSVLDALLGPASGFSRDAAITETYKWAAIASAAQFAICKNRMARSSASTGDDSRIRDVAQASWLKAREMVFANIGITRSFRLALSLVVFGDIAPEHGNAESAAGEVAEDRSFALCEGIQRLQRLCSQARRDIAFGGTSCPTSISSNTTATEPRPRIADMTRQDVQLVLELIGSLEWLISLLNAVAIGTSRGRICAFSPAAEDWLVTNVNLWSESPERLDECDASCPLPSQTSAEAVVLWHVKRGASSFISFWRDNLDDEVAVLKAGRVAISLSVILWKSLARLTLIAESVGKQKEVDDYAEISGQYSAMMTLIGLWRTHFGVFDQATKFGLQRASRDVWRMLAFNSMDADLAILLFYEISKKLEMTILESGSLTDQSALLNSLQSTRVYRSKQQLVSAMQVALISSTWQSLNSAKSEESSLPISEGYMWAHPVRAFYFFSWTCNC